MQAGGGIRRHFPSYNKGETYRNRNWNQNRSRGIETMREGTYDDHQR